MSIYRKGSTRPVRNRSRAEFFTSEIADGANLRFIEHADVYISLSLSPSRDIFSLQRSCLSAFMMILVASGASFVVQQRRLDVSLSRDDKHLDALKAARVKADITDAKLPPKLRA